MLSEKFRGPMTTEQRAKVAELAPAWATRRACIVKLFEDIGGKLGAPTLDQITAAYDEPIVSGRKPLQSFNGFMTAPPPAEQDRVELAEEREKKRRAVAKLDAAIQRILTRRNRDRMGPMPDGDVPF